MTVVAAVATADQKSFTPQETLTAVDLNANFSDLDQRVNAVNQSQTNTSEAVTSLTQQVNTATQEIATLQADTTERLESGNGLPQVPVIGPSVNPTSTQMAWQSQTSVVMFNGSGLATINFPDGFATGVLNVMLSNGDSGNTGDVTFGLVSVSKTSFVVEAFDGTGNHKVNTLLRCNWLAIGW